MAQEEASAEWSISGALGWESIKTPTHILVCCIFERFKNLTDRRTMLSKEYAKNLNYGRRPSVHPYGRFYTIWMTMGWNWVWDEAEGKPRVR